MNRKSAKFPLVLSFAALLSVLAVAQAHAAPLKDSALVDDLRQGGCVIVMRHASSPPTPPGAGAADPQNVRLERQLDETGRKTAAAMGAALKTLRIPIGAVLSSPTYRALETVRLLGLPAPQTFAELGDGGQSMRSADAAQSDWLRARVAAAPSAGTDTLIVTHNPNIAAAFGQQAAGLADGEALVFRSAPQRAPELIGQIKIGDWLALARRR